MTVTSTPMRYSLQRIDAFRVHETSRIDRRSGRWKSIPLHYVIILKRLGDLPSIRVFEWSDDAFSPHSGAFVPGDSSPDSPEHDACRLNACSLNNRLTCVNKKCRCEKDGVEKIAR